jgi:hypothetical protein
MFSAECYRAVRILTALFLRLAFIFKAFFLKKYNLLLLTFDPKMSTKCKGFADTAKNVKNII